MQSRYYDPEICRFISADNIDLVPTLSQTAGQLNLYVYCNNNPVMYTDPTGEIAITTAILIGMGIGAAVGLGIGLGMGLANGARGWELVGYIVGGVASGIIAGGIIAASIFTGGAAMSFGYEMLNSGMLALAGGGAAGGSMALAGAGVMVAGGALVVNGVAVGMNVLLATYTPGSWPGDNTSVSPGDGFAWKGKGDVGSNQGNWYNAETGEILHPDLNHPKGIDPHWDYRDIFGKWFRERLFPNHHPHELRHTFVSRCKECGVASEVVSIWAGHSLSGTITTTVYTHYSDEFQLSEAEKVDYM